MALIMDYRHQVSRPRTLTTHAKAMHSMAVISTVFSFGLILSIVIGLF